MFFIILLFPLLFLACGEAELVIHEGDDNERELNHNYWLLRAYFYHPERIKQYEEYSGWEIDSMYKSLKDYFCGANYKGNCGSRYTFYLPPEKSDEKISQIENTKKYYSFGFERIKNRSEDTLIVSAVYPISPAFAAGLKKRDILLSANGISLIGAAAAAYLENDNRFEDLTAFRVLRNGEVLTLPAMQKADVQKPTVYLDSLLNIPYIRVTEYKVNTNNPNGTYAEFKKIMEEIKGAKTAIMDLRDNGGGNIGHCTKMAAELVPLNNELIYDEQHYYDNKRGNVVDITHEYARDYLRQEGSGVNIKWIILINGKSASCSERFLAAVKYNRPETFIIGQTSYGKGIGQVYTKTYLGGLAYITCLQTYYPNGDTFHNIGIKPDKETAPEDTTALRDAIIKAVNNFSLAKRSYIPTDAVTLPPERQADDMELGAYRRIETPLFHQWE